METLFFVFLCQILASILLCAIVSLYHYITVFRFPCGPTWIFILLSLIVLDLLVLVPYLSLSSKFMKYS